MTSPPSTPSPPTHHILITGASSGLGRAFFEHYAAYPPTTHYIRGIDASPWPAHARVSSYPVGASGHFTQVDLTAEALVQRYIRAATIPAGAAAGSRKGSTTSSSTTSAASTPTSESPPPPPAPHTGPFTLIIHCAGIRGLAPASPSTPSPSSRETIAAMDAATMRRAYDTNTVATFSLIKALLPSLRPAPSASKPKILILTSRMGSLSLNDGGGAYAYRASKAALNAVVRSLCLDVPEAVFGLVHPGAVETACGRVGGDDDETGERVAGVEEVVGDVLGLVERLGEEGGLESGCFVDRWGVGIPW